MREASAISVNNFCSGRNMPETKGNIAVNASDRDVRTDNTRNTPDNQYLTSRSFREFVVIKLSKEPVGSIGVRVMRSFCQVADISSQDIPDLNDLRAWIASMFAKRLTISSRKRYFGKLHSLFLEYCEKKKIINDPFDTVRPLLDIPTHISRTDSFANCKVLDNNIGRLTANAGIRAAAGAFLYMLYTAESDFSKAVGLTTADCPTGILQFDRAVDCSTLHHRRRYVFNLQQSQKRRPQLVRELSLEIEYTLSNAGMKFPDGFSGESIKSLWIARALMCGLKLCEIRAVAGNMPAEFGYISLVQPAALSDEQRMALKQRVADSFIGTTPHWYAMKLRKCVTPTVVRSLINEYMPQSDTSVLFFYPTRKVARREDRKIVFDSIPFIPDILFFKARSEFIGLISQAVCCDAWIFRRSNSGSGQYSIIPDNDMFAFQTAVQQFTNDMQLDRSNRMPVKKGRRVRITAGQMKGYEGLIYDIKDAGGKTSACRMFCIMISPGNCIRWTADIEEMYIEPVD